MLITAGLAHAQVTLRESRGPLAGAVTSADAAGVTVTVDVDGRAVRRIVGWDQVKRVEGAHAAAANEFTPLSDALWRARARLERGDWLAAEPLLAPWVDRFAGDKGRGPSAAVLYDGLLRCRLARGARAGAVTAWLELLATLERSAETGARPGPATGWVRPPSWIGGGIDALPVIDVRTGLSPSLPPIWVGEPAMEVASERSEWTAAIPDAAPALSSELAAWYTQAGRFEAGAPITWPTTHSEAPGPRLVRLIVLARTGDASRRQTARTSLASLITPAGAGTAAVVTTLEDWEEAWCRAGLGRSLLRESEPEQRIRGVIQLLHVPARLARSSPYLAGVCLAESAVALADLGDTAAGDALKQELATAYPGHPALAWSRLQNIKSAPAAPGTTPLAPEVPTKAEAAAQNGGKP